ncbi:MAG: ATP-binding cassette domain-containing protein [Silvanigrellales bacterium]|nr:ATP-binding cassette domain-containing protein [Silvanigrellales bacterium]
MIEVKGLVKLYGDRKVLHGLDFSVGPGRVCGFLGPNGSGKSTTMDILAGLLGPSDGEVRVCGHDVVTHSKEVKAVVGYLPDNPPLHREMKVREFVDYVARLRGQKSAARKVAVDRVLEDCDVSDVADRVIGNLSKGYRQRVALCSALVHQPKVLILDEPTEGLDPNQIVHIRELVRKLAKDRTVILSSHILSEVQATCDDVIIINQGRIAAKTSLTEEASRSPSMLFSFQGQGSDAAASWLREKSYVTEVRPFADKPGTLVVDFLDDFCREGADANVAKLNASLVQGGFGVTGIAEHKGGIEELFFHVIKSQNQGGLTP